MNVSRRDAFQAVADSKRRAIIDLLSVQELTLNQVAGKFDISRPAVSKHIKILAECGLVAIRREGRQRYCHARVEKLREISNWLDQYRMFWEERFDKLEAHLHKIQTEERDHAGKK